jgi:hypothetical protein
VGLGGLYGYGGLLPYCGPFYYGFDDCYTGW